MPQSGEQYCDGCEYLLCCQQWSQISWQCTKGKHRRQLLLEGTHVLRRLRCKHEGWYQPRQDAQHQQVQ